MTVVPSDVCMLEFFLSHMVDEMLDKRAAYFRTGQVAWTDADYEFMDDLADVARLAHILYYDCDMPWACDHGTGGLL